MSPRQRTRHRRQAPPKPAVRELGDLTSIRRVLAELEEREAQDRVWRGQHDVGVHVLAHVRRLLEAAIEEATRRPEMLTLAEYADYENITLEAAKKRWGRGRIPGAAHRNGRVVVPLSTLAY